MAGKFHELWKKAKASVPDVGNKAKLNDDYGKELDKAESLLLQARAQANALDLTIKSAMKAFDKADETALVYQHKLEAAVRLKLLKNEEVTKLNKALQAPGPDLFKPALPLMSKVMEILKDGGNGVA